jgi:PKD repeat protein
MREKSDQRKGVFKIWFTRRGYFLVTLVVFVMIFYSPVTAATTSIHIVKYANDGTTILAETTRTYQWMQANLPVLGDGTTHYYHQGPVFINNPDPAVEEQLRWNPGEDTNVQDKDQGAVKGTNLKNLCDLVGGMNEGEYLTLRASDGFTKSFAYTNVYEYTSRQGPMVITWYQNGNYPEGSYTDAMKLVFFADTSTNPWGIHAMGNYDWHESAAPEYWYYYISGTDKYPTTTGLSVKYISDVFIYSDDPPPSLPNAAFSATPRSGTAPLTVSFTDASTGTGPLSYAWDFKNDGSVDSTLKNPGYQYTAAGIYTVNLTITGPIGSDSEIKTNYISVTPLVVYPTDTVGIYRNGAFYLRNTNTAGPADIAFGYGIATDTPLIGDWNGDGTDTVGIYRNGAFYLRNTNTAGPADIAFGYGIATDTPLIGDWDGT